MSNEILRTDLAWIVANVPAGSRVLDLGCSDGTLLQKLRDERGCSVRGIEIDQDLVVKAIGRGIPVSCIDLDEGLHMFPDDTFDVVILSQTLQMIKRPANLLAEILRIGSQCLVSYPNFAHWKVRAYLMFKGRMPVSEQIPYTWYETPNIHHTTMPDFADLVAELNGKIADEIVLREVEGGKMKRVHRLQGLRGEVVVALLRRGNG